MYDYILVAAHARYTSSNVILWTLISRVALQTVCAVLGVALGLQALYMPYEHGFMNYLEFLSLVSCTVTIYFSLYFTYSVSSVTLVVVTVIVTLINVLTIAVFMVAILRANWHMGLEMIGLNPQVCECYSYSSNWAIPIA